MNCLFKPIAIALIGISLLSPGPLAAQTLLGGQIGYLFDTKEDQFSIGADARIPLSNASWTANPRLTHYLIGDGFSLNQIDLNMLYRIPGQAKSRVQFYVGGGVALVRQSFDGPNGSRTSETKAGLNYVTGAQFPQKGSWVPWVQTMYTAAMDYGNSYVASVGLSYKLKR
jgi:hypothetical protein